MSLHLALNFREQLSGMIGLEFEQFVSALQVQFDKNRAGPVRNPNGGLMSLVIGLKDAEQLPPYIRDELEHIIAALQVAFNAQRLSWIKQVVPISITIAAGVRTNTQTLATATDLTNTILDPGGWTTDGTTANAGDYLTTFTITDSTTVTAARSGTSTEAALVVTGTLTEYYAGFWKSIQRGTIMIANGNSTATATLATQVDTTKAAPVVTGYYTNDATLAAAVLPARLALLSGTTLQATRAGTPAKTVTTSYEIREPN